MGRDVPEPHICIYILSLFVIHGILNLILVLHPLVLRISLVEYVRPVLAGMTGQ